MGLFEKFKTTGTKLVNSYKGDIKGSSIQYPTSEINGVGNGKGNVDGNTTSVIATIANKSSKLHNEASTLNNPAVKNILGVNSYTQKYHKTALNPTVPDASSIDEGSKATFIAPSSPSVKGRSINTTANSIPSYSSTRPYRSQFEKYKLIDPNINSRF
jgi:hypothetical protein